MRLLFLIAGAPRDRSHLSSVTGKAATVVLPRESAAETWIS